MVVWNPIREYDFNSFVPLVDPTVKNLSGCPNHMGWAEVFGCRMTFRAKQNISKVSVLLESVSFFPWYFHIELITGIPVFCQ